MFTELMPCLQVTIVTLTNSRIDGQLLRVNIVTKRKTDKESAAEDALSTPLTVTATAAELDQDYARQVLSFSRPYQRSAANMREIEEAHAAAVKAAEEERKNDKGRKSAAPPAKTSPGSDNDSKVAPCGRPLLAARGKMEPRPRRAHSHCSKHPPEKRKARRGSDGKPLPQSSRWFWGYCVYAACVSLGGNQREVGERIGDWRARLWARVRWGDRESTAGGRRVAAALRRQP